MPMNIEYYNGDKKVTKEEFDKERQRLLGESYERMKDPKNHIAFEDLDYYLNELEKMRDND